MSATTLPPGLRLVRTTPEFDASTVPPALLRAHRVGSDAWGLLVVRSGSLRFVFEDRPDDPRHVGAGESQVIPPDVPHHVEIAGHVRFVVEFHRRDDDRSLP